MTRAGNYRWMIFRIYRDDEKNPSVEAPLGDFFLTAPDDAVIMDLL
ncbi:MAG TPA: DUF2961 domain-containing protein [Bacteroidetes bacterium]|nr:DUF2961 domain-containing protein [Bacteroidota bacterium]